MSYRGASYHNAFNNNEAQNAEHFYENFRTADLEACPYSADGKVTNLTYKSNYESHGYEDTSFRHQQGSISFYGILDGHDGEKVARFGKEQLLKELCYGQTHNNEELAGLLHQSILKVDLELHQRMKPLLEERALIKTQIAGTKNDYEAYQRYPNELQRLAEIEDNIKGGSTAVVSIVTDNTLYVANVGDSRAVLCRQIPGHGGTTEFKVDQLTEDHNTCNDNELDRLAALGLNRQEIQEKRRVGCNETTRAIGDFAVKWGYKDFDILSSASGPPVIAEPHVTAPIPINNSFYFLFLMSDGVYRAVEEASECGNAVPDPNIEIANLIHEQLAVQNNLAVVVNKVLDIICKRHEEEWKSGCKACCRRDDMTLIVRMFNNPARLIGHTRNHSGNTIFRSSFSYTSSGGDSATPQPVNDVVDMLGQMGTNSPGELLSTLGQRPSSPPVFSPPVVSPVSLVDSQGEFEPYIKFNNFPDELFMKWLKTELKLPSETAVATE